MNYELTGKLVKIYDTVEVSEKFKKREFIVEVSEPGKEQYAQLIKLQSTQDRCDALNLFKSGENVNVSFNLRGRKWTNEDGEDKYFTNVEAWRVTAAEAAPEAPVQSEETTEQEYNDDLPF